MSIRLRAKDELLKDMITALKILGSPFAQKREAVRVDAVMAPRLYGLMQKNKIGLLFLESIGKRFPYIGLTNELIRQRFLRLEQLTTLKKVTGILERAHVEFVAIKTLADYPYVANDVDILVTEGKESYNKALQALLQKGFVQIEHAPLENCFHDSTRADHVSIGEKDVYDVDLYYEIGASHLVYLDKRHFRSMMTRKRVDLVDVPVLRPEAELLIIIFHSIYPEQLFTFSHYYSILYNLAAMDQAGLRHFVRLAQIQRAEYAVKVILNLVATLHQQFNGTVPTPVLNVASELGGQVNPVRSVILMPYRLRMRQVSIALLYKLRDELFRRSAIDQMLGMSNLDVFRYIVKQAVFRRRRETY